jgi:hypothetical protein
MKFKIRDAQEIQDDVINLAADIYEKYKITMWMEYDDWEKQLVIDKIEKRDKQKDSRGYWALKEVVKFADDNHIKINIIASPSYGTSLDKLLDLYQSFGFKKVGDIPGGDVLMIREPKNIVEGVNMKLTREDIYKYGTKEEIQFLLEAIMPGNFVKSMMNFKNYLDSPQGKEAKAQYQNLLNQIIELQKKGSTGIVQYIRDNQKPVGDFITFVDLLLKGKRPPEPVLIPLP